MNQMLGRRKNKTFDYKPRYYQGDGNPHKIMHKFDEFRSTVETPRGLKAKFIQAMLDFKQNQDSRANRWVFYIVILLILIFLFTIDFDLSIFKNT